MKAPVRGLRRVCAVVLLGAAVVSPALTSMIGTPAEAASSGFCDGGGYSLVNLSTGDVVASGAVNATVPASAFAGSDRFGVRGLYNQFDVRLADFALFDYAFLPTNNAGDMTNGVVTPVFESKIPDHRGAVLTSGITVEIGKEDLVIGRSGAAISMKIQAKDCAQGGVFQMEPSRGDGTRTRIVHTLASPAGGGVTTPFYFDNPNFRARIGQFLGSGCTSVETGPASQFCVQVTARVNIANDFSRDFVARDSAQVATRINQADCNTATPITPSVRHCGGQSVWDVASGGRMGFVTGTDAVEVANPPTNCTQNCQAQNRVRGRLAVLGFPFEVPAGSRLVPRVSALPLPPPTP